MTVYVIKSTSGASWSFASLGSAMNMYEVRLRSIADKKSKEFGYTIGLYCDGALIIEHIGEAMRPVIIRKNVKRVLAESDNPLDL